MLGDLPPRGRWYILSIIVLRRAHAGVLLPRASFTPIVPFIFLVLLSSLTSAFKIQFPIASGSNMSVSYVVDIASLILRGPHATMLVGAASGWSQTTLNARTANPLYRTLFNIAILVLTVEASGQVYPRLGGTPTPTLDAPSSCRSSGMALTYFFVNTIPIALAIALTTNQSAWRIWKTDFASSAPSYLLGAAGGGGRHRGHGELGLLAHAAAHGGAAVSDLQDVPRRRADRGAAGRDSRSRARRAS